MFLSIYYISIALNLILLFLVLWRGYGELRNRFIYLILSILSWITTLLLFYYLTDETFVLWVGRLNFLTGILIGYFLLVFVAAFPTGKNIIQKRTQLIITTLTIIVAFLCLTPLIGEDEIIDGESRITVYGVLFPVYIASLLAFFIGAVGLLLFKIKTLKGRDNLQVKLMAIAIAMAFIFGLSTNVFFPYITGNTDIQNFGPLATVLFIGMTTYAIMKHRLLDIRLAVREVLMRISIMFCIFLLTFFLINILNSLQMQQSLNALFALEVAIILVISAPIIEFTVRRILNFIFFSKDYSRRELIKKLSSQVTQSINIESINESIKSVLDEAMRAGQVDVLLINALKERKILFEHITANPDLLIYDELKEKIQTLPLGAMRERLLQVKDYMAGQEIAVVVPLTATGGVIGAILLGEKKGRDAFTTTDVEILETLMYQAGVAIENAALFEETRQFNKKLQQEITIATRDLQMRNRRLSVLRKLDNIILNTPNLQEMTQKITDLVSWEMGFVGALMVLLRRYDDKEYLEASAMSSTPLFEKVLHLLPMHLTDYKVEFGSDPSNLIYRAIHERQPLYTQKIADLYVPPLPLKIAEMIQRILRIEHHMVYPLSAKGKPLGAIVIGLPKPPSEISHDEEELIQSFLDETGLAIENVLLNEEIRDRNEDLRNANNRLRELDKMKDELVSIASHELRTPMTAIKSYLWMALNKEKSSLNDNLRKYLDRAFISSDRMIDLVNDMLSASRLEGNRLELHIDALDIRPLISDVVFQLNPKADEKGLKLNFQEAKGEMPHVLADPERVNEIMMNLVGNALKYTDKGTVEVSLRVEDKRAPHNDYKGPFMWVLIKDTGRGISKDDMPRLFKKFGKLEQGSFTKSAETGGTGLGLYITKGLVTLHGGDIWVESKPNKGSVFGFSLPIGTKDL